MAALPSKPSKPNNRKRKRGEPKPVLPIPPNKQPIHTPWVSSLPSREYETKEQRLHDEIVAHTSYVLPTPAERLARQSLYDQISSVLIWGKWRNAKLHLYGSVSTDLCLPRSDIDLVFEVHQVADTQEACKSVLFEAKRYLYSQPNLAEEIFVVGHARVPVLNMVSHPQTGHFNVDITVNGKDGVPTIALVKQYLKTMPALKPLVLLIKALLEQHGLHSAQTSGLSSYCVICMVISFLQVNPMKRPQKWIDDPMASESFGWLLLDFFDYYGVEPPVPERPTEPEPKPTLEAAAPSTSQDSGPSNPNPADRESDGSSSSEDSDDEEEKPEGSESKLGAVDSEDEVEFDPTKGFPYMTHYISVREGKLLLKKEKGWLREKAWENGRLSIECLANPENDIARSAGKIKAVRQLFRETRETLVGATLKGTGHNVLGTIVGVTQETLDFRENIRKLVERRQIRPFSEMSVLSGQGSGGYNYSRSGGGSSQYRNYEHSGGGGGGGGGSTYSGGYGGYGRYSGGGGGGGRSYESGPGRGSRPPSGSNYGGESSRNNDGHYKRQKR